MFIFTLGNSSDAFLILRAQNVGNNILSILEMLIIFNIVYAVISVPSGILSDRLGRKNKIKLGWIIYALTYFTLANVSSSWQIWPCFILYGVYYGIAEGVTRAYVADIVPETTRGTAYGLFHGLVGFTLLPASIIAGWLWQFFGPENTFYFGAILSAIAAISFFIIFRK